MYLPASADMSAWESVSIIEKRSSVCRSNNGQNHSKRLRMQKWLCGKTQSRSTLCLFGRGFVCVFPKLEHLPTMQFDHQQFRLSFLCAVFLAANVTSGREKQTTEVLHAFLTRSASSQVWHRFVCSRIRAFSSFSVRVLSYPSIFFCLSYQDHREAGASPPVSHPGWETGSILDMSPFLSL